MNPDVMKVTVMFKPITNEMAIGWDHQKDTVGRLAAQELLRKGIAALDQMNAQQKNQILLPEPVMQ